MYTQPERNWDKRTLAADHSITRHNGGTLADRLLHATCNEQRGDGSRDHLRPALGGTIPTPTDDRTAWCLMDWRA